MEDNCFSYLVTTMFYSLAGLSLDKDSIKRVHIETSRLVIQSLGISYEYKIYCGIPYFRIIQNLISWLFGTSNSSYTLTKIGQGSYNREKSIIDNTSII